VFHTIDQALSSMDKTASAMIINKSHPLVTEMHEYCTCLQKMAEIRGARDEMNTAYAQLTHFVKNASKAVEGLIPKALRHTSAAAKKVAPHVGHAAGTVKKHLVGGTGEGTKKSVSKIVEHLPHAATAGVVLEGARRISNDPNVRAAYHGVNARVNPTSDDFKIETLRQRGEL
jgi:hypothetical protein